MCVIKSMCFITLKISKEEVIRPFDGIAMIPIIDIYLNSYSI